MKKIVVAFDSFKGSLTSREAGEAFAMGYREVVADADIRLFQISDGGEGLSEAIHAALGGEIVECRVTDPLGRQIEAAYAIVNGTTAVVSLAAASGLTLLAPEERNPLVATTFGTGELILDAIARGCRRIIVGLGGSATTDGGAGMLRALGYRFYDAEGEELTASIDILERAVSASDSEVKGEVRDVEIAVAVDVDNPLYGQRGAAYVFAPQKGAAAEMVVRLDDALRHYAKLGDGYCGYEASTSAGVGAAGGVGYAFRAFMGRELTSGIELLLDIIGFDAALADATLVVTGEGRVDAQTLMGKAPSGVLHRATKYGVDCIAVGGCVEMSEALKQSDFKAIYASMPETMSVDEAMQPTVARENLRRVGRLVAEGVK